MGVGTVIQAGSRAVFLDRDGVLNRALVSDGRPGTPSTLDEFVIVPEAPACLEELNSRASRSSLSPISRTWRGAPSRVK